MAETATSYKDPGVLALASNIEQQLELPKGLLAAVVTRGERSNSDQVSEAGARGLGQIIPATRKAAIDKYGIDPYLSDENSLEVAGRLLKDSLGRNKGDIPAAVAEYHGGTDRSNWGARTKAYVQRVTGAAPTSTLPAAVAPAADSGAAPGDGPSTFDKLWGATNAPKPDQVANILKAYQSGAMAPEDAKQFKADVDAGHIMLPAGATLQSSAPAPTAMGQGGTAAALPQGVVDAFDSGKITGKDREQLLADIAAGRVSAPTGSRLELAAKNPDRDYSPQIPDTPTQLDEQGRPYVSTARAPQPGIGDMALGAGEAALSTATGIPAFVAGAGSYLDQFNRAIANKIGDSLGAPGPSWPVQNPDQAATQTAQQLTYQPRTDVGQDYARAIAEGLQPLAGLNPLEGALIASGARPAVQATAAGARAAPGVVQDGAAAAGAAIRDRYAAVTGGAPPAKPTAGTMASGGSAGTDVALQRAATAAGLPVPIKLTRGQALRDGPALEFETETAKDGVAGAPLRENAAEQNQQLAQNFDAMIDRTGAEKASDIEAGRFIVDDALKTAAARSKAEYQAKYTAAEKAGELEEPVSLQGVIDHLNESAPEASTAPLLKTARDVAISLGIAKDEDGKLVALPPKGAAALPAPPRRGSVFGEPAPAPTAEPGVTLKIAEQFRKAVNRNTGYDKSNQMQASMINGLVDQATEGKGGALYKEARQAYQRHAQLFKNNAIVSDLLATKRGTADRKVALEGVMQRIVLGGSRDDLTALRRTLHVSDQRAGQTPGGAGAGSQAWREVQAATLRHIADEAGAIGKNASRDTAGRPIISFAGLNKAIRNLDDGGRLDFILGKKDAQTVRDIAEVASVIKTIPPGFGNPSGTSHMLLAALGEAGAMAAFTGLPAPLISIGRMVKQHRDAAHLRLRVQDALDGMQHSTPTPAPQPRKF
jgi:hypothetical protein